MMNPLLSDREVERADSIARGIVPGLREFATKLFSSSAQKIEALERRIAQLEQRPEMVYTGVFDPSRIYREGQVVTESGSMWCARRHDPGPIPGPGWTLCVKRGRDSRRYR